MKRRVIKSVIVTILALALFCSCSFSYQHYERGLENYTEATSSYGITSKSHFVGKQFLEDYHYADGDYYYEICDYYFGDIIERSFVWLIYNDGEIYQSAKQNKLESRNSELPSFDGAEAYGFTFYINYELQFPQTFTTIGFNDEKQTLIFIGFHGYSENGDNKAFISLAETDFAAFLKHYYGEWYNWE